ncbi:MAG: cobalamin-binding protein [SAR86 cluster bacterium]|uniref:Cobalamin-binding protein n=1 Tax=SAR86 cluster bacterium TaxID=2030880 RepID=A0A2A5B623_9GAMM|nr:MAG: cobalamin-binding protein [SAR86 cluster bacterium]
MACVQSLSAAEAIEEIERIEVIDDEGSLVRLSAPAERIISLAPSLTELIFAAGAGDKLVGVVEYSDYPAAAKELPLVGRHDLLDMERILQLNPDLVVAWQTGNPRASVNRLKELGLTVYIAEPKSLDSIPGHLERLSTLAGTKETGAEAANFFRDSLQKLNLTYSNKAPVSTFYQVWDKPLISAGGNELINDIIELCGGVNIFSEISLMSPKVSQEAVLARNPEAIIASGMDIERPEWLDNWKRWSSITAVARNNLFFIPPDLLQRHTPRALLGAKMMCEQIDQARSSLE